MMSKNTSIIIQMIQTGQLLSLQFYSNCISNNYNVKLNLKLNCFIMSPTTASREQYPHAASYNPEAGKKWSFALP